MWWIHIRHDLALDCRETLQDPNARCATLLEPHNCGRLMRFFASFAAGWHQYFSGSEGVTCWTCFLGLEDGTREESCERLVLCNLFGGTNLTIAASWSDSCFLRMSITDAGRTKCSNVPGPRLAIQTTIHVKLFLEFISGSSNMLVYALLVKFAFAVWSPGNMTRPCPAGHLVTSERI